MKTVMSVCAAALALAACNKDPASLAARDHSGAQATPASFTTYTPKAHDEAKAGGGDDSTTDARDAPVPKAHDGKPMWTANKRHTAEENAEYAFERDGEAFGAKSVDDFVAKAHAFTSHPPAGIQRISRKNGDVELYDAKTNVFAVVSKDGAPRTMFKPDTGADYWTQEEAKGGDTASGSSKTYSSRYASSDSSDGSTKRTSHRKKSDQDEG